MSRDPVARCVRAPRPLLAGRITCPAEEPIVCAVDVTGSMEDWPKVIYDKLPMFYGPSL